MAARRASRAKVRYRSGNVLTTEIEVLMNNRTMRDVMDAIAMQRTHLQCCIKEDYQVLQSTAITEGWSAYEIARVRKGIAEMEASSDRLAQLWRELHDCLTYHRMRRKVL